MGNGLILLCVLCKLPNFFVLCCCFGFVSIQWAHQKRNYEQTLSHSSQEKIYFLDVRLKTNVFIDKIY